MTRTGLFTHFSRRNGRYLLVGGLGWAAISSSALRAGIGLSYQSQPAVSSSDDKDFTALIIGLTIIEPGSES
jgi:hypothetical protein